MYFENILHYPTPPQTPFCCGDNNNNNVTDDVDDIDDGEMLTYIDIDAEAFRNFDLFSESFSLEDLVYEIPEDMNYVREDCMWAAEKIEERIDIDLNNNNCPPLRLISPDSIITRRNEKCRSLITPLHFSSPIHNPENNCSPTPSFDSSDETCTNTMDHFWTDRMFPQPSGNESDGEIDVVGDVPIASNTSYEVEYGTMTPISPIPSNYHTVGDRNKEELNFVPVIFDEVVNKNNNNIQCVPENHVALYTIKLDNDCARLKRKKRRTSRYVEQGGCSSGDSSGSETTTSSSTSSTTRTVTHNHLERKRRINLKRKFEELRDVVMGLADNQKAPKVVILTQATEEITKLEDLEQTLIMEKQLAQSVQEVLKRKVEELSNSTNVMKFYF